MWFLKNETAYGAERNFIRDKLGVHHFLVAVQATFDFDRQGSLKLSDEQPPPPLAPEYRGDPATTSLRRDSELLYCKAGTEVLLDACAHAPSSRGAPGSPATTVPVTLKVGPMEKSLLVHGERLYRRGLFGWTLSTPQPFWKQPIQYEWAYGGTDCAAEPQKQRMDQRNPVGKGIASPATNEPRFAHTIEYPHGDPAVVGPAGFGPIASHWSPRRERSGTFDKRWEQTKKPLLPDDFDERFGQSAPDDQHLSRPLRGGEPVFLGNLTPEGEVTFQLPKIYLAFRTQLAGRAEEHRAALVTVFIDTEARKLSMVWQTALRVASRDVEHLDFTRIAEKTYIS